jgi:hypothetical protein
VLRVRCVQTLSRRPPIRMRTGPVGTTAAAAAKTPALMYAPLTRPLPMRCVARALRGDETCTALIDRCVCRGSDRIFAVVCRHPAVVVLRLCVERC